MVACKVLTYVRRLNSATYVAKFYNVIDGTNNQDSGVSIPSKSLASFSLKIVPTAAPVRRSLKFYISNFL